MDWQSVEIAFVFVLVVLVFFGFVRERVSPDVVAMLAFGSLLATGILTTDEALSVFSNSGPLTIAAMFVLSAALERTGLIERAGTLVAGVGVRSPIMALVGMTVTVMALSAFINNTPVVAILTPIAIMLARAVEVSPSKLLIPLSFASIFGGTTTLIGTSTNLLVNGVAVEYGLEPFGMFEITGAGLIMGGVGIAYMALFGRWLLPDRVSPAAALAAERRAYVAEMVVPRDSPLIGKGLKDAGLTPSRGAEVFDVVRGNRSWRFRLDEVELQAGDRLVVHTNAADVMGLRETGELVLGTREEQTMEAVASRETVIMEGIIGPRSRIIGARVADLNFRRLYGIYILAVHRQGQRLRTDFDQIRLEFGDGLLLEGPPDGLRRLFDRRVLVNLTQPGERPFRRDKAPIAVGAILAVMVLAAFEVLPIVALALIAAAVVTALGCLTADEAYESIQWRIMMLIFGMLAVGMALETTGAAALVAQGMAGIAAGLGPIGVLAGIYILTSVLTEIVSNNATAILVTPIAIGLAEQLGIDPRPLVVAVLFAASASFATPIGYQTNTFVYGAGGYRFADFLRIGVPLNLLMWAAAVIVIPLFWEF